MQNYEPLVDYFDMTAVCGVPKQFKIKDLKLKSLDSFCTTRFFDQLPYFKNLYSPNSMPFLEKKLASFDILHTAELLNGYTISALNSKKKNIRQKIVATIWENIPFAYENTNLKINNRKRSIKEIDHFIAVTKKAKEVLEIEGADPNKISVLLMGIDLNRFKPKNRNNVLLKKLDLSENDFVILFIGRNVWEKGLHDVLLAVKRLVLKDLKIKTLIIGDGPMHEELKKMAENLRIINDCIFIKQVPYNLACDYYNLADVFVLPSIPVKNWQEQFGMVLIEAMACGIPVISSVSGSIAEVVGNAGLLVSPSDFIALSEKIKMIYENLSLRKDLGYKSLQRANDFFDAKKVALEIKKIYDNL